MQRQSTDVLPTRARLTDHLVRRLPVPTEQRNVIVWDDRTGPNYVRGFGVRVSKTGNKTYLVHLPAPGSRSRRIEKSIGYADQISCAQARHQALEMWEAHRLGRPVSSTSGGMTVSDACKRFLAEYRTGTVDGRVAKGRKVGDSVAWRANMRRLSTPLKGRTLESVRAADMQKILDGLPRATARVCKSNWSTMFKYAIQSRWLSVAVNPCEMLTVQQCEETIGKRKLEIPEDDQRKLFRMMLSMRNELLPLQMELASLTGSRSGELCKLLWRDNPVDGHQVFLVAADGDKKNKKKAMPKTPNPAIADVLKRLHALTGGMETLFACDDPTGRYDDAGWWKKGPAGKRAKALRAVWRRMVEGTDMEKYTPKHYRSTFVTKVFYAGLAAGLSEEEALRGAGEEVSHSDVATTERSYRVERGAVEVAL